MLKASVLSEVVLLLALWSQYSWWEQQAIKAWSWPTPLDDLQEPKNVIIFILVNPLPRLIPRHWKDQQTPFVFSSTVHELHRRKVLRSWTCRVSALPVCCETEEISSENYTSKHKLPFPQFFFPPVRPPVSLSFSLCLSPSLLRAVAGCFQRKRCRPSGLFINMLIGEQVFGRGNKAKIIINPVRWIHSITLGCIIIGVFFFLVCGERSSTRTTKLWEFFSDDHKNFLSFFFFPPRLLSAVDGEGKKRNCA